MPVITINGKARSAGLFGLLCLLVCQPNNAADAQGQYGIRGAGLVNCALYEHEREIRSPVYQIIAGWMDGYITGINQYATDTYDTLSFESTEMLAAVISKNCKKHPNTTVFTVLNAVINQAAHDRLHSPSKKVEVKFGERSVLIYQEVLLRLQKKLTGAGFYRGPIDGSFNAATRKALGKYQSANGLKPTEFPDQVTLWRIFRSPK
jgi:hypothetical protein